MVFSPSHSQELEPESKPVQVAPEVHPYSTGSITYADAAQAAFAETKNHSVESLVAWLNKNGLSLR